VAVLAPIIRTLYMDYYCYLKFLLNINMWDLIIRTAKEMTSSVLSTQKSVIRR